MHYLTGSLLLLFIWLIVFLLKKDLRLKMLISSLIVLPLALSELAFVPEYWQPDALINPQLSVEDFIFTFAIGGIIAVLYELFFVKKFIQKKLCDCFGGEYQHGLTLAIGLGIVFSLWLIFKINFMYAVYFGILFDILVIVITRKDLIRDMVVTSVLFGFLYFVFFAILVRVFPSFLTHWSFGELSGMTLFRVPLEEIIWAFGIGALIGPIYEYILGVKLVKLKRE